ncbi:hypothetical protein [Chryseobacterium vrystaatense]|uniref:hypothetical protein n=1 Tax=Chryseobacterium vrystaatense TaxID=307480 RepID=UPI00068A9E2C|nr:hypothetical protein [Chryseobacterium vrystaatense]
MKTKPILFSTDMVQANVSGAKTMTRRVINEMHFGFLEHAFHHKKNITDWIIRTSKYQPGDVVWVRETFAKTPLGFIYKANVCSLEHDKPKGGWKPSIHMPKEAARTFLKVGNVRCERLQDISEADAIAEGCSLDGPFGEYKGAPHPNKKIFVHRAYRKASRAFQSIWEHINGVDSWRENPWVWVYEYEIIEKPENFLQ